MRPGRQSHGRFIPFIHLHAFHVVQQLAAVQYRDRIANAERFGVSCVLLLRGFSLQLAEGRADLYTELPVKVNDFKQPIDEADWTITTLTRTVSADSGFTTSIEFEVKIDDMEIE